MFQVHAPVQLLPFGKIYCVMAPAPRIPSIAVSSGLKPGFHPMSVILVVYVKDLCDLSISTDRIWKKEGGERRCTYNFGIALESSGQVRPEGLESSVSVMMLPLYSSIFVGSITAYAPFQVI